MLSERECKKIYDSSKWKRKRIEILRRDNFECQDCKKRIADAVLNSIKLLPNELRISKATQVHHIHELKDRPDLAFNDDNLISLCHGCHDKRHGREPKHFCKIKNQLNEEKW